MRTFLVSYDLARPHVNKHRLAQAIMSVGERWARPLEQTWYVRSTEREEELTARLRPLLDDADSLVVQAVEDDAVLTNTALSWHRFCRTSAEGSNILAFPERPKPPPAQAELPFARRAS